MGNRFDPAILKKLRVSDQQRMLIVNAPEGYLQLFANHCVETEYQQKQSGSYDFVQVFGASRSELESLLQQVGEAGKYDCLLWACYPKGGGEIKSDLKREGVWELLELIHMHPVAQIALDETWSALRGRPGIKDRK